MKIQLHMDYKELYENRFKSCIFYIFSIKYIFTKDHLISYETFNWINISSLYKLRILYHEWNIPQFSLRTQITFLYSFVIINRDTSRQYFPLSFHSILKNPMSEPWKILQSLFTRAKEHRGCTLNYDCRPRRRDLFSRREEKLAALVQRGRFVWPREARVSLPSLSRARDTRAAGIERLRLFIVSHLISARLIRSGSRGFIARSGSAVKRMAAINPPPCSLHCWSGTVDAPAP